MPDVLSRTQPRNISLSEIASQYLPLTKRTLQSMLAAGTLPPADIAIGARVRLWNREKFEAWLETQRPAGK